MPKLTNVDSTFIKPTIRALNLQYVFAVLLRTDTQKERRLDTVRSNQLYRPKVAERSTMPTVVNDRTSVSSHDRKAAITVSVDCKVLCVPHRLWSAWASFHLLWVDIVHSPCSWQQAFLL